MEREYEKRLLILLRKLAFKSRQFCDRVSFPYGLLQELMIFQHTGEIPSGIKNIEVFSYDYDYYAFTKSTKTLHAIWALYKDKKYYFNEDILNLVRSIFENHILSRYLRETIDSSEEPVNLVRQFINNPLGVSIAQYQIKKKNGKMVAVNNKGDIIGETIVGPSAFKIGSECDYYSSFYAFLCSFTHCNFGSVSSYMDGVNYSYRENQYRLEALLFAIFVFTKIFEGVVTVEGEEFNTYAEEKECYDLVYDALELQQELFTYLVQKYSDPQYENKYIYLYLFDSLDSQRHIKFKDMLEKMQMSLDDNIGSVIKILEPKDKFRYIRQYPQYD